MIGGHIASCLRKEQCGPLPHYKSVCFCEVEAYDVECRAACYAKPAVLSPSPLLHSIIVEEDCIYNFAAIGNGHFRRGEVLLDEFNNDLMKLVNQQMHGVLSSEVDLSMVPIDDDSSWVSPPCPFPSPGLVFKPNPGITQQFDSIIPYRHQTADGHVFFGNTVPPIRWEENRIDIVIRAQLLISIEQRIRVAWADQINPDDRIRLSTVRPSPAAVRGQRPLHVLIEVNRRQDSILHPVLLAHREIDSRGPSNTVIWKPTLLASPVSLDTFHTVCGPPCGIEQLLVPQPGRVRRWLQQGQSRVIRDGIFIPIWWDLRIRPTAEAAYEEDTSSLMQSALHPVPQPSDFLNQRSHVLDRWCTFGDDIEDGILAHLHKQNVPGIDGDFIQVVEWTPQGSSPTTLPPDLEERSEDPDATISTDYVTAATDAPLVFRTYGFFGEDAGQRDVQVNGDSLFTWKRKVLERWNDFGIAESLSTWVVRPHPPDAGIAAHIIVSRPNEVNGQLVLFEHSTLGLRSVVSCGVDDTGFQIAFRAGFAVRETQTARFRNEFRNGDGSESPDDTSFMQRPCPLSAPSVKPIDKPTILQAVDYGVDLSTSWTEIDPRWTTPCHGLQPTMPSDMEVQTYESNKWEWKQNPRGPLSVLVDLSWNCRDDDSMDGCFRSFKPNPGILEGIDATVPYRHRTQDGFVFTGRTIPPPHWEQHPLLRSAANFGAVHRNSDGELNVLIRSWIVARQEHLVLQHRDFTIRAQLMHEVESKIRQFWPDYILPDDLLTLTRVRPAPNIGHRGQRPLHILVEVNREDGSTWQPVLMANREINEHGPSNVIRWTPALVPPNIDMITVHALCAPPCAAQQMLIPHPGRVRRWLEMGQNRQATAGLFLPLWWDRRLQVPQGDAYEEDDQHTLLQTPSGEKDWYANCKLLDNWYEATTLSTPQHLEREGEAQEDLAPILIIDEWEPLMELLAEPQESPAELTLIMHGLFQTDVGQRETRVERDIEDIRAAVLRTWEDYFHTGITGFLHIVKPQDETGRNRLRTIVEMSGAGVTLPVRDVATLRRVHWQEERGSDYLQGAAYHTPGINNFELFAQTDLAHWCLSHHSYRCNVHIENQILLPLSPANLRQGSRIDIFVHQQEYPEQDEVASLMQQAAPSQSPSLRQIRLRGLHCHLATILIDSNQPLMEAVAESWPYGQRSYDTVIALHPVEQPPAFQSGQDPICIW